MGKKWSPKRLKSATIGERVATYEVIPATSYEVEMRERYPQIFKFEAISIGDNKGQAFLVPLDESSREVTEYLLRAIAAYEGD